MGDFWFGCGFLFCVIFFLFLPWATELEFTAILNSPFCLGLEGSHIGIVGFSFLLSPQLRGSHSLLKPGGLGDDKISRK